MSYTAKFKWVAFKNLNPIFCWTTKIQSSKIDDQRVPSTKIKGKTSTAVLFTSKLKFNHFIERFNK